MIGPYSVEERELWDKIACAVMIRGPLPTQPAAHVAAEAADALIRERRQRFGCPIAAHAGPIPRCGVESAPDGVPDGDPCTDRPLHSGLHRGGSGGAWADGSGVMSAHAAEQYRRAAKAAQS